MLCTASHSFFDVKGLKGNKLIDMKLEPVPLDPLVKQLEPRRLQLHQPGKSSADCGKIKIPVAKKRGWKMAYFSNMQTQWIQPVFFFEKYWKSLASILACVLSNSFGLQLSYPLAPFDFIHFFLRCENGEKPVAFNPSQPAVQFSFQTDQQVGNVSIRMGLNKISISRKHDRLLLRQVWHSKTPQKRTTQYSSTGERALKPNYEENKDCLASWKS